MKPAPQVPPVPATACDPEWIELRREVIRRDGRAVRAGERNTIEIKSITPLEQLAAHDPLRLNAWAPIALPGGAVAFTSADERDAVLRQLTGPNTEVK